MPVATRLNSAADIWQVISDRIVIGLSIPDPFSSGNSFSLSSRYSERWRMLMARENWRANILEVKWQRFDCFDPSSTCWPSPSSMNWLNIWLLSSGNENLCFVRWWRLLKWKLDISWPGLSRQCTGEGYWIFSIENNRRQTLEKKLTVDSGFAIFCKVEVQFFNCFNWNGFMPTISKKRTWFCPSKQITSLCNGNLMASSWQFALMSARYWVQEHDSWSKSTTPSGPLNAS